MNNLCIFYVESSESRNNILTGLFSVRIGKKVVDKLERFWEEEKCPQWIRKFILTAYLLFSNNFENQTV